MTTPPNHNTADQSGADERAKFEAWYAERGTNATFKGTKANIGWYYFDEETDTSWDAWQGRAALASTQPAPQAVMRELEGYKENAKMLELTAETLRKSLINARQFINKDCWIYVGDGNDHLESMSNGMSVVIRADQLRELITATPQPFTAPAVQSGELLNKAMKRMDQARDILTDRNPRTECNWGMLDTSDLRQAIAQTAPAVAGEAWLPIETAPKDGTRFLAWNNTHGHIDFFRWQGNVPGLEGWRDNFISVYREGDPTITLWQPMPAAPTQGANQ